MKGEVKLKIKLNKRLIISISLLFLLSFSFMLSSCKTEDIRKGNSSIAMVKNISMSTYGTGFAVGMPGKAVDTIVTSYSVIATPNGVPPKTAEVSINETENKLSANVAYYDVGRNIAILKLAAPTRELKSVILEDTINQNETVFVRGYDGTGNIMSDFEKFNTTDIIQYSGNVSTYDELNTIVVYKYSNEFNRAMVGAPAVDKCGNVIGMCAYSLNSMNTYSQYILSSEELVRCFIAQEIDFMTADEVKYKNIIISSVIIGIVLLAAIMAVTFVLINKKVNNLKFKNKYIRIADGALKGQFYKFDGKLSIGRDSSKCKVLYPMNEPGISGVHCTIQMHDGDCYLVDNFSKYGTFLEDGTKVASSTPHKIENEHFAFYVSEPKNRFEFVDKKELKRWK